MPLLYFLLVLITAIIKHGGTKVNRVPGTLLALRRIRTVVCYNKHVWPGDTATDNLTIAGETLSMIIPEVAPMLTCTQGNDGFHYELVVHAKEGQPAITQIRIGPYYFKKEYQPQPLFLGLSKGGPENSFGMHKYTPRGWSRLHWEIALNEPETPAYLVSQGTLAPGTQGRFQFLSFYAPWGMRVGLEVYRQQQHQDYGVCGPNYEPFLQSDHEL